MDKVEQGVRKALYDMGFPSEPSEVNMGSNLRHDLGLDSLDKVEFAINIEREFNINVDDVEIESMETLGEVIEHVSFKVGDV